MPVNPVLGPTSTNSAVIPEDTKVDLRRYCGYPAYGVGTTGFYELGYWLPIFQQLEYRLNNMTVSEYARITDLYLANLLQLEQDIFDTRQTVNIQEAAVYKRNLNESRERHTEFMYWRKSLCQFLGISPGPEMSSGGNNISLVV